MTQNLQHQAHEAVILPFLTGREKPNVRSKRQIRLRDDSTAMLQDMAFVLKMTQRVRDQINTDAEANEPVTV